MLTRVFPEPAHFSLSEVWLRVKPLPVSVAAMDSAECHA